MTVSHCELLDMATDMGVFVDFDDMGWLPVGHKGGWFPEHDLVLLREGLSHVEQLCTLAHELGHVHHGHTPGMAGWWSVRQEMQADRWAAQLLVSPVEYEAAERLYGHEVSGVAYELGVTRHVVEVWQKLHVSRLDA